VRRLSRKVNHNPQVSALIFWFEQISVCSGIKRSICISWKSFRKGFYFSHFCGLPHFKAACQMERSLAPLTPFLSPQLLSSQCFIALMDENNYDYANPILWLVLLLKNKERRGRKADEEGFPPSFPTASGHTSRNWSFCTSFFSSLLHRDTFFYHTGVSF